MINASNNFTESEMPDLTDAYKNVSDRIVIIRSGDQTEVHIFRDGYSLPRSSQILEGDMDVQVRDVREQVPDDKIVPINAHVAEPFETFLNGLFGPVAGKPGDAA